MAGEQLRVVRLADDLADIVPMVAEVIYPAVRARLIADGELCAADRDLLALVQDAGLRLVAVSEDAEQDAGFVVYALELFRANARGRRSLDRRRGLELRYGALPMLPGNEAA